MAATLLQEPLLYSNVPAEAGVVTLTEASVSPVSTSLKPKLAAARVRAVSSLVVSVLLAAVGASLTAVMFICTCTGVADVAPLLSLATTVKAFSVPLAFCAPVQ